MPLLKVKVISDTQDAIQALVNAYVAGAGAGAEDAILGQSASAFPAAKSGSGKTVIAKAIAHGGMLLPVTKTADVQHVTVTSDKVDDVQDALDAALAAVEHARDTDGDTTTAGRVLVGTANFFASEDVGRKINVTGTGLDQTRVISAVVGYAASGSITAVAGADLVDGEKFTLYGIDFEFDDDASVVESPTLRALNFTSGDSAATVRATIKTGIEASGIAGDVTCTNGTGAVLNIVANDVGEDGNEDITETVVNAGFVVSGMSGGVDLGMAAEYSGAAIASGTGRTVKLLGAESMQPGSLSLNAFRADDGDTHITVDVVVEGQQ